MAYTGQTVNPADSMANSHLDDSLTDTDLSSAHEQKNNDINFQVIESELDNEFSDAAPQTELKTQPESETTQANKDSSEASSQTTNNTDGQSGDSAVVSAAKDVGRGITEAPLQVAGGIADGINNSIDSINDVATWMKDKLVGDNDIRLHTQQLDELNELFGKQEPIRLPTTEEAESTTGKVVRSISQFLTGFVGAGKALGAVGEAGKLATVAKGAIADFAAFDPAQDRLSDLIQSVPELKNPVTDYLSNKEDDSKIEGRIKNALEGLGAGALADGLIKGIRGLRNINKAREAAEGAPSPMVRTEPEVNETELANTVNGNELPDGLAPREADIVYNGQGDLSDETYVNWSRIDSDDDVKAAIQAMADRNKSDIDAARRGTQSFEETKMNAESVNAWDVLQSRRQGEPLNAEQSLAVRQLWTSSGDNLTRLAKEAQINPSQANLFAMRKAMAIHQSIQNQVIAARTETARALSSWRIPAGSTRLSDLADIIEMSGGEKVNQQIAESISLLADNGRIKELDDFVNKSAWARTSQAISQVWINSLLSSPHTHIRNFISQTAAIGQQLYERKAAQLIAQAFGYESEIPTGEIGHMLSGISSGLRDSFAISANTRTLMKDYLKKATHDPAEAKQMLGDSDLGTVWKSLLTGESGYGVGKIDTQRVGALNAEAWNKSNESVLGKALNFIDTFTQTPGRALAVSDELFKTVGYRMELQARAAQMASNEVNSGMIPAESLKERMTQIIENPPSDIKNNLDDFAKYVTFQDAPDQTKVWNLWKSVNRFPVLGKIVLPFTRTPYNIARYSFERTPLAPFVKRWREDFEAGGARKEMAVARMATGTTILLTMADLAMSGHITGAGPDNAGQRQALRRMGIQPNSVKVETKEGTRYFSYTGLDPISTPMLMASNIVDILANSEIGDDDINVERAIVASSMAIANQVTSQQYMSGVSSFIAMLNDPGRYGDNWFQRLASSTVPRGVAYLNRTDDPYAREAFNMIDAVKAQIPGLSKDLPERRDLWGRPVDYRSGLGDIYDFISPIYSKKKNAEPIDQEMNRLELYIPMPNKNMVVDGVSIDLRKYPKAYSRYVQLAGNEINKTQYGAPIDISGKGLMGALNQMVKGKGISSIQYNMLSDGPDGGKATMIRQMVSKYRDAAKKQILEEFPDIKAEHDIKKEAQPSRYSY